MHPVFLPVLEIDESNALASNTEDKKAGTGYIIPDIHLY